MEETPRYLYKILSLKLWQASQNRNALQLPKEDADFIHFSKEDQLERILTKYWADAPQYVVLTIDTKKLVGDLIFETNPGGSAKYYHLYNGYIPFQAIVESKITYREHAEVKNTLNIVQLGDPILRTKARELRVEEILEPEIQDLIEQMKATMRAATGVGLAAPQIGRSIQLAVIEDMDHSHVTEAQLHELERQLVPFHVVINPKIYLDNSLPATFFEACLSIPNCRGAVPRARSVRVECLNERGEPITIHATGWYARILQHEVDHLNGTLYTDHALPHTLTTDANYQKIWKNKTQKELASSGT